MVRIPASWAPVASRQGSSGPGGPVAAQRAPSTPLGSYTRLITVDLGNDGVAPNAIFNAAGQAWAFCGPNGVAASWSLDQCYLSTSIGPLDPAQGFVYMGPYMQPFQPVAQYAKASNLLGGGAQFGLGGLGMATGWFITAYWTGGTPGAIARLSVTGTKTALSA